MEQAKKGFIWDNLLAMSAYWASTGAVVASLTAYYGFPLWFSNLITGLSGTLLVLQLAGGFAYGRTRRPLHFLRWVNGAWRGLLPLAFFSVLLPKPWGAVLMPLCYAGAIGLYQFAAPSQTSWLVDTVEGRVKSNYYSMREMFFMFTYTGVFCAVTLTIDQSSRRGQARTGFVLVGGWRRRCWGQACGCCCGCRGQPASLQTSGARACVAF